MELSDDKCKRCSRVWRSVLQELALGHYRVTATCIQLQHKRHFSILNLRRLKRRWEEGVGEKLCTCIHVWEDTRTDSLAWHLLALKLTNTSAVLSTDSKQAVTSVNPCTLYPKIYLIFWFK
jgi:hypothetical protein